MAEFVIGGVFDGGREVREGGLHCRYCVGGLKGGGEEVGGGEGGLDEVGGEGALFALAEGLP